MWKSILKLNEGDNLVEVGHRLNGVFSEEEVHEYSVVSSSGEVVGYVTHYHTDSLSDHSSVQRVLQRDMNENIIVDSNV